MDEVRDAADPLEVSNLPGWLQCACLLCRTSVREGRFVVLGEPEGGSSALPVESTLDLDWLERISMAGW